MGPSDLIGRPFAYRPLLGAPPNHHHAKTIFTDLRYQTRMTLGNGHRAPDAAHTRTAAAATVVYVAAADINPTQRAAWTALAATPADLNSFAEPWCLDAGLATLGAGHAPHNRASLALVHDAKGILIGVAPIARASRFGRMPLSHAVVWNHANSFLAPIMIRDGYAKPFWMALLNSLSQSSDNGPLLCIEQLANDGAVAGGLRAAATALGVRIIVEHRMRRALLTVPADPDAYWDSTVRAKKRKELRRQWARLRELGRIDHRALMPGDALEPWLADFLTLEQGGWKGVQGSALASAGDTRAFFTTMAHAAHANGQLDMRAIMLDGTPIAMLITLIAGDVGYSWKTAYDERYARYSPGVLIQRESIAHFRDRGLRWIDSCAAEDHPMIDSLWHDRRSIVTMSVALPGRANRARFAAVQLAKSAWHGIKAMRGSGPSA